MAIDSREKRQSAAWLYTGLGAPSVTPNASPDKEWRQQAGWGYSGIAAASGTGFQPVWAMFSTHVIQPGMQA